MGRCEYRRHFPSGARDPLAHRCHQGECGIAARDTVTPRWSAPPCLRCQFGLVACFGVFLATFRHSKVRCSRQRKRRRSVGALCLDVILGTGKPQKKYLSSVPLPANKRLPNGLERSQGPTKHCRRTRQFVMLAPKLC